MTQIKIDVSESQKFVEQGILVLTNGTKKFYARVKGTNDPKFPYELIPLTTSELKKLGLNVEESAHSEENSNDWNSESFEESEQEPDKNHKIMKVSASDPESIANAKAALARIEAAQNVDQITEERDQLRERLSLLAEAELEKKRRELGAPDTITTPEELMAFEKGKNAKENTGSAPINPDYNSQFKGNDSFLQKSYPNSQAMVEDVRRMSRDPSNVNQGKAQAVLDKWIRDWATAKRENPSKPDEFPNPNSKEEMAKLNLVEKNGMLISSDKDFDSFGRRKRFLDEHPRVRQAKKHSESE